MFPLVYFHAILHKLLLQDWVVKLPVAHVYTEHVDMA